MKKLLMAAATVALLFATSCKNDVNAPENIQLGENEFLATIDNGAVPQNAPTVRDGMNTMTIIDGNRCVFWETGDEIKINGVGYKAKTTANPVVFEPTADGVTASQDQDGKYHAFYPAGIAGTGNAGTLPAVQTYTANHNVSNLPMYACSTTKELTFHNICAVLKIVVPEYFAGATKIEVSSNLRMNGEFYVENNKLCLYDPEGSWTWAGEEEKKITIEKLDNEAFNLNEEVYIAVPAYNYNNFTVAAIDGYGAVLWDKTLDVCELEVNKIYPINITNITYNGLCFTAVDNNNVEVTFNDIPTLGNGATIKYSTDGTNWDDYESGSPITLTNKGDKVYFQASKAHNTAFYGANFEISGDIKASGNIMSLYGPDCPNINLPNSAFWGLFSGCYPLLTAPKLPATELASECYAYMFDGCGKLQKAPVLPATTLATECYANMFEYCYQLNEVWIYATNVSAGCLSDWLNEAGTDVPAGTTRTVHCKTGMGSSLNIPQGWTIDDNLQ